MSLQQPRLKKLEKPSTSLNAQKVPTSELDELVTEIGGVSLMKKELKEQVALVLDPHETGYITRTSFINWYCELGIVRSTANAKKAGKAFDSIDKEAYKVPTCNFYGLVQKVGGVSLTEDELKEQVALVLDPHETGYITRTSFIN